ncbi:MAG: 2-succinyl-5-enolpyruvyl-6-hydroxy-3-cyclohexene-1-carboxylic-acid synthase [Acidimicrobiia bacterium]|nr:2-succinyl-5-enolpyruvyl-6-hydroxy-3-cyclohexene-1-carboxylic-acid synthase [Acidimicrobiia bacterium]
MTETTVAATFCATLVDEWVRARVTLACVAPGSRSTPLALALAADARIEVAVFTDERSAAFAALGHGLATGRPAVALCTSGTAATHFHAAVVEADLSSVPLIACTADRPPELWDLGAPQTIDQTRLFGVSVRFFAQPGVPDAATAGTWRPFASRLVAESLGWSGRPGPVQANLSFRDPLVGVAGDLPAGRPGRTPWYEVVPARAGAWLDLDAAAGLAALVAPDGEARPGVIVAGRGSPPGHVVQALARRLGWPVLADHRSGCRSGSHAVTHFDALLRSDRFLAVARPEVVLRLGEPLASKVLGQWLAVRPAADPPALVVAVIDDSRWIDPELVATTVVAAPGALAALLDALGNDVKPAPTADIWLDADNLAAAAIARHLFTGGTAGDGPGEKNTDDRAGRQLPTGGTAGDGPGEKNTDDRAGPTAVSEVEVARAVVAGVPAGGALVVSSSMPVRDVEWYGPNRSDIDVFSNRGANGIDGVIATGIGVALEGRPTTVLVGDVAFLHDSSSLAALRHRPITLDVVVVDNDGGGIFSFLPQASQVAADRFEQLFGTPHGTDLTALARAHGLAVVPWPLPARADPAHAPGVRVCVVRTDRAANVALHSRLTTSVLDALRATTFR